VAVIAAVDARRRVAGSSARLLAATAVSTYGDWLTTVAVAVGLYRLTATVTAPALAILLRVLPRPAGAAAGGRLADRHGAAPVLTACLAAQGGLTLALGLALAAGSAPGTLVALVACQLAGAAAQPALMAAIPGAAGAAGTVRHLTARLTLLRASAVVAGPAAAGLALLVAAPATLVVADAATFALAVALLLPGAGAGGRIPAAGRPAGPREPLLLQLAVVCAGNFAVITALQAVLVLVAADRLGSADHVAGLYCAVGAGGAVACLALSGRRLRFEVTGAGVAALAAIELGSLGALTVVGGAVPTLLLLCVSAAAATTYQVAGSAELARRLDPAGLGRANGRLAAAGYAGMLAGGLLAVTIAPAAGWVAAVRAVWALAAVLLVISTGLGVRARNDPFTSPARPEGADQDAG
jgi:hypothetical protein